MRVAPRHLDILVVAYMAGHRSVDALQAKLQKLESQLNAFQRSTQAVSASACLGSRAANMSPTAMLTNAVGSHPLMLSKDETAKPPANRTQMAVAKKSSAIPDYADSTFANRNLQTSDVSRYTVVTRDERHQGSVQAEVAPPGVSVTISPYTRGVHSSQAATLSEDELFPSRDAAHGCVETPATDGMVEYMPNDSSSQSECRTFVRSSPALDFALQLKRISKNLSPTSQGWSSRLFQTNPSIGGGFAIWRAPEAEATSLQHHPRKKPRRHPQYEHQHALKLHFSDSYQRTMPQLMIATALLDRYFVAVHPIWPFLIEQRTRDQFERIFISHQDTDPAQLAHFNLIFALGCLLSSEDLPVPDIQEVGEQFYFRALGFIIAHAFNACNVDMLQMLLLLAQYQQGTLRSNECWLMVGQAINIALALGIQKDSSSLSKLSRADIELQKRLWWGCFCFDRICSMTYGTPIRIPRIRTATIMKDLPAVTDDAFTAMCEPQPPNKQSKNSTFVYTASLYQVMDDILERLQEVSTNKDPKETTGSSVAVSQLAMLAQLDTVLLNWFDALPAEVKFTLDGAKRGAIHSPAVSCSQEALKIRYLGMRLLLHRRAILFLGLSVETRGWPGESRSDWPPLFSDEPRGLANLSDVERRPNPHSPFLSQLAQVSAKICVDSAKEQIEALENYRTIRTSGAWWWDFHFLFNALCVLIGALGLREDDRTTILPDHTVAYALVRRGVHLMGGLATREESKILQSQAFLERLLESSLERSQNLNPSQELTTEDLDYLPQNRLSNHERFDLNLAQRLGQGRLHTAQTPTNCPSHVESPAITTTDSFLHSLYGKDEADWQRNLDDAFPWPAKLSGPSSEIGVPDMDSFIFDSIL